MGITAYYMNQSLFHQLKHSGGPPAADTAVGVDLEEAAFLKKMIQPLFVPEEVIVSVYVGKDRNESLAEKNVNDFLPQSGNVPDRNGYSSRRYLLSPMRRSEKSISNSSSSIRTSAPRAVTRPSLSQVSFIRLKAASLFRQ